MRVLPRVRSASCSASSGVGSAGGLGAGSCRVLARIIAGPQVPGAMKRYRYWVLAATVVGGVLRLLSTGNGTLWRDEAMFVFVTRMPTVGGMLDFLHRHEWHTPLFYLLVRWWGAIAGPSEAALAAVPIVAAVALIPVVYLVGARAFSPA